MKLNRPGIYRIIGENFELLANVIGEAPCLRITSALLINDLVQKGKFTVLNEESIEIQTVLVNPDKFVFFEYEYSEVVNYPPYRMSIRGSKSPDITEKQFKEFTNRYIEDTTITGRGITSTKAYIVEQTGWSLAQAHIVILEIIKRLKHNGYY